MRFRTFLGCLVAAVLLPVLALAAYLSVEATFSEKDTVERGMRETARALSLAVDGQLSGVMSSLDALAASASFRAGNYAAFRGEAETFLADHAGWLSIVDEDGQQHMNTRLAPGAPLPKTDNREWLHNVFSAQPFFITDSITGPVVKQAFVAISRRARGPKGKPVVLVYSVAPEVLSSLLQRQRLPTGWYGVVADRKGVIVGRTQSPEFIGQAMTVLPTPPEGFVKATTLEGDRVYLAWSTSPVSGWSTGVAAPAGLIDDLLLAAIVKIAALAAMALILAAATAAYLARFVTRPMDRLVRDVQSSETPEAAWSPPAPVAEINTLTAAFRRKVSDLVQAICDRDAARASLETLNQQLEARVQERTIQMERLNEHLFQLQKQEALGRLTGGIAHDFNNLLMAVLGNLELLAKRLVDNPALKYVDNARGAAKRGAELTGQLLAFSRNQNLQAKPIDVGAALRGTAELLRSTLGSTIHIEVALRDAPLIALADATQLELVLLNLAVNARDAMPTGGLLRIESYCETIERAEGAPEEPGPGSYVVLAVSDTGTGMSEEVRARAFEPFFTTKPTGKGSGLGLPHVLGVTKQLGGGIRIRSQPGGGTRVEIFLRRSAEVLEQPADAIRPAAWTAANCRVLLVDDDPDVRFTTAAMLEELGCSVTAAGSGAAAAELMERDRSRFDLALVDYAMPGMNGIETAERLRRVVPALPIALVTGYADAAALDQSWNGRVLKKPFELAKLAAVLAELRGTEGNVVAIRRT